LIDIPKYIRHNKDGPLITVYGSGKYIIVGSNTNEQLQRTRDRFLELLVNHNRLSAPVDSWFEVQNIVGSGTLGQEIDLKRLLITLGLENAEYEPEQFPGIVYRDPDHACVVMIFRTGKIVVTGSSSKDSLSQAAKKIKNIVADGG
jgi:transcription initiation factor TFIID TATA-box-binding protein